MVDIQPGEEWTNWSGSLSFTPAEFARPRDEDDVAELMRRAAETGRGVRPVGSGHSSTPVMATEDTLVSLDRLSGVVESGEGWARLLPGTGLSDLGAQLAERDLGMENLGDVDYQAIAGAIGTGTHGTGEALGNLSSTLVGGTLVTGTGELRRFGVEDGLCVPEAEEDGLTRAAQVSLGALGVLTSLTLRVRSAYELHRRNWITHIDWVLGHFDALARAHRHVDFYWYPRSDLAQVRVLDEVDESAAEGGGEGRAPARSGGEETGKSGTGVTPERREIDPAAQPRLSGLGTGVEMPRDHTYLKKERRGPSYEVIPNDREIRFDEMEYMLPRAVGLDVFREVRERIKQRHRARVAWRVLVRTIAPDRGMLSNAYGRETMTIALLQNNSLPYEEYFQDVEPILLAGGGRPHWGKKHTRTAADLAGMYPEWEEFRAWRRRLDPAGVLLNDHLRELLEEE